MKMKKLVSGLLACAMVVTSVFTGNVTAVKAESPAAAPRLVSPDEPIAYYNFDSGTLDGDFTKIAAGNADSNANLVFEAGKTGKDGDKSIKLGDYALRLDGNIGESYTVSVWVKSNVDTVGNNGAIFLLGLDNPEDWIGFAGKNVQGEAKLWSKSAETNYAHTHLVESLKMKKGVWTMLTLAQEGNDLSVYQDGVPLQVMHQEGNIPKVLNGENKKILLGATYWADGTFNGWMDDVRIYNKKLSAEQIKDLYETDPMVVGNAEENTGTNGLVETAKTLSVGVGETETIKLKDYVSSVDFLRGKVTYTSSDATVASVNAAGEIQGVKAGTAKVTVAYKNGVFTKSEEIQVTVKDVKQEISPIATYDFGTDSGTLGEAEAVATGFAEYKDTVGYDAGRSGKAVKITSSYGVRLKEKNLGSNYTVSMWVKNASFSALNKVLLFVGNDTNWVGVNSNDKGFAEGACKLWSKAGSNPYAYPAGQNNADIKVPNNEWTMVTVSQSGSKVALYLNGKEIAAEEEVPVCQAMNGENQCIGLGVNPWSADKLEDALVDDVHAYDTSLDATQVAAAYLKEAAPEDLVRTQDILNGNENANKITKDLKLPQTVNGVAVSWVSDVPAKITNAGEVLAKDGSKVTLTASATIPELGIAWEKDFVFTLAKTVTIKHVGEKDNVIRTETVDCQMGAEYVYTVKDKVLSTKTAAYIYDEEKNTGETLKIASVSAENAEITVKYNSVKISSIDTSKMLDKVYVIEGNTPVLPYSVKGAIAVTPEDGQQSASTDAQAGGETPESIEVPILWDDYSVLKPSKTPYTLKGTAAGHEVSVQLTVYECDEAIEDKKPAEEEYALKNKYRGVIVSEFDILTGGNVEDGCIGYYDTPSGDAFSTSGPMIQFKTNDGYFVSRTGNGDGTAGNHPADKASAPVLYDGQSVYHVRLVMDSAADKGNYHMYVTDSKGKVYVLDGENVVEGDAKQNEITQAAGNNFRKYNQGIMQRWYRGRVADKNNFTVANHKISWQSGYVTRKVEIYVDNAKEEEESAKLLPSRFLSDEAAEGEVSERAQAYAYEAAPTYDKDGEECVLQEEESGWFKADGTKITDPAAVDVAVEGAEIVYKAYYKKGAANFAGLKAAITAATKIHTEKTADKIYVQASLDTLKAAIDKAQAVYDTKGKDNEADKAEVEKAITDLNAAKNAEMSLKNYADMSKELTAFYLMTENVNDTAGTAEAGKHNGVVTGNVTFSKEDGAAFPGGDAYKNYVNLPTDIPVTDKMTFSFWAYDQNGGANTFGMGSGKKLSNGKTLDGSTTNAHHFSIYVRGNGKLRAGGGPLGWGAGISEVTDISIDYSKWNLVTCVVEGKNLIVYLNGAMAKEGTTGISLTEAWNANSKERYMFIGNNIYGANGDGDFKGNIKNFRIYNAPLAAGQVKDIYENEINAFLDNAASLLAEELKAQADASGGKYTLTITDSKITLPKKGAQNISVSWKAYDADGKESDAVINAQTGAVTLPASGKTSAATLRATLDFNGVTKEVEIACTVMKLDEATLAARKALGEELDKAEKLKEADYTSASWAIFQKTVEEALAAYNNPTTADALTAQATKLANAMKTDGTGTLVPRGDRTGLDALVKKAEDAIKAAEADRDKYDGAVWKGLEDAIKEAKALSGDVSQKEVDDAESKLQAAFDAFRPKDQSYSKDEADRLAAEADKLLEGKNEYEYDEKAWADMQEALAAVRALTAASTPAEVTAAYKKLEAAMEAFKPKTIDKAALGALADDAKEELGKLSKDDYDPKAWAAVEEALAEVEKLAADADASDEQIRAAYGKLWTALKELKAGTYIPVESVTLSKKSLTLNIGKTATLKATVKPANASSRGLTWKSSKPKVVYVGRDGKVEARAKGTADVTVTAGGRTAACRVTVKVPVKKVKLTANYTAIATGKKATVKASVTPANASNKKVKWAIDKAAKSKKYATISQKGVLKAGKKGAGKTVTVTATAQDGSKKKAAIKIKIMKNAVTKVSLKAKAKNVKAGKKLTIKATVQNTGGKKGSKTANTKLAWSVDKKSKKFASINSRGVLSTKKAGKGKTVTVTASSTDGTNKKGSIKIKITK
ncbi:MAG: hypothetical protein HFH36_08210 [Lachnospiraceae bacterium]|nr:hypothetical protein [Lachnospiraceae bacterium]